MTTETVQSRDGVHSFLWKTHLRATEHHLPYAITPCCLPCKTGLSIRLELKVGSIALNTENNQLVFGSFRLGLGLGFSTEN